MMRILLITVLFLFPSGRGAQAASSDSQTLQAILAELRQLRHDLQATSATTSRVQIALYRLERENEAVERAIGRVSDARSNVAKVETDKGNKLIEIEQGRNAASHSDDPNAERGFNEVALPSLKSQLELLQKREQRMRAEEAEAEQQLRDEQLKVDGLNDLLDRYNNSLEDATKK
jgi:chromosome segregation ATPase